MVFNLQNDVKSNQLWLNCDIEFSFWRLYLWKIYQIPDVSEWISMVSLIGKLASGHHMFWRKS